MNKGVEKLYQVTNVDLPTKKDDNDLQYINTNKEKKKQKSKGFFQWLDEQLLRI